MATINGRFNEVEAWGGEGGALPPGEYTFVVEGVKQGQSQRGNPQLELDLKVINEGEYKGRTTKQWYTLNFEKDGPRKRLKALIVATGIALDGNGNFDDQQLKGTTFTGDVQVETYEVDDVVTGKKLSKERTRIVNERSASGSRSAAAPASAPVAAGGGFTPNAPAAAVRGAPLTPVQ